MAERFDPPSARSAPPWLYRPATLRALFRGLVGICVVLAVADFIVERHGIFAIENVPVSYGLYGFVSFVGIVFAGKALRRVIMRDEDYYDR
ncbi:MAG: hypothetical protein D6826_05950 [Alphaproteobacteria bacterium]|nr:MAG: hypothetical protein D6826_05950 [Alphaproteobacteria bacterium]